MAGSSTEITKLDLIVAYAIVETVTGKSSSGFVQMLFSQADLVKKLILQKNPSMDEKDLFTPDRLRIQRDIANMILKSRGYPIAARREASSVVAAIYKKEFRGKRMRFLGRPRGYNREMKLIKNILTDSLKVTVKKHFARFSEFRNNPFVRIPEWSETRLTPSEKRRINQLGGLAEYADRYVQNAVKSLAGRYVELGNMLVRDIAQEAIEDAAPERGGERQEAAAVTAAVPETVSQEKDAVSRSASESVGATPASVTGHIPVNGYIPEVPEMFSSLGSYARSGADLAWNYALSDKFRNRMANTSDAAVSRLRFLFSSLYKKEPENITMGEFAAWSIIKKFLQTKGKEYSSDAAIAACLYLRSLGSRLSKPFRSFADGIDSILFEERVGALSVLESPLSVRALSEIGADSRSVFDTGALVDLNSATELLAMGTENEQEYAVLEAWKAACSGNKEREVVFSFLAGCGWNGTPEPELVALMKNNPAVDVAEVLKQTDPEDPSNRYFLIADSLAPENAHSAAVLNAESVYMLPMMQFKTAPSVPAAEKEERA